MTEPAPAPPAPNAVRPPRSYGAIVWKQFRRDKLAVSGLCVIVFFFLVALAAPLLANNKPFVFHEKNKEVRREVNGQIVTVHEDVTSYPLLREVFAPSPSISEKGLERGFNFAMLLGFIAAVLFLPTWALLRCLPEDRRRIWKRALPLGLVAAAAGVGLGTAVYGMTLAVPYLSAWLFGWRAHLETFLRLNPDWSTRIPRIYLYILGCGTPLALAEWAAQRSACARGEMSPPLVRKWLATLLPGLLAAALVIPFIGVKGRLDKRDYVAEAEAFAPGSGSYAVFPPVRYNPFQQVAGRVYWSPCRAHPLGTDSIGRDILTRVIHGARVSLAVGFVAVAIYLVIGVFMGSLAGYHGGWVDITVSRFIEVMMGFPTFLLILTIIAVFEARSVVYVMIIIGLTRWTGVARLMRGEVLKQRKMDYVSAARALGVRDKRIMFRHILPNAIAPVLVSATFGIAGTILTESSLAFLGLGVRPPTATWGDLLRQSLANPSAYWWLMVFPGAIIFLSILSYNLAGEGLRDAIDPRLRK